MGQHPNLKSTVNSPLDAMPAYNNDQNPNATAKSFGNFE